MSNYVVLQVDREMRTRRVPKAGGGGGATRARPRDF